MKIKKLKLKNFANFTDFELEFNGEVTRLVGINGSGKTTIGLTAIWACLKGIAEKSSNGQLLGERFRFIGNSKASADLELTVFDEKTQKTVTIKNHLTKDSNKITCEPVQDSDWLNNLLSVAFLSTKNFTQLSSREQALELGIDVSKIDTEISDLRGEYTFLNRVYKSYGVLQEVSECKEVNIGELLKQKEEIDKNNEEIKKVYGNIENTEKNIIQTEGEISKINEEIKRLEEKIEEKNKTLDNLKKQKDELPDKAELVNKIISTKNIIEKIENAQSVNSQAAEYKSYIEKKNKKDAAYLKMQENKEKQEAKKIERIDYIKSFKFGFDGLQIDDNGGLLLDGRPIKSSHFSHGELEMIVVKLQASLNPKIKFRFLDDFELLDEDNQAKLLDWLVEKGFQVVTAEIGKKAVQDNTILLRECKQVDEYENTKAKLF